MDFDPPIADININGHTYTDADWSANFQGTLSGIANDVAETVASKDLVGTVQIALSGDLILSGTQAANIGFIFTGSPGDGTTVTWPAATLAALVIENNTAGSIIVGMPSGDTVTLDTGISKVVLSDGVNFKSAVEPPVITPEFATGGTVGIIFSMATAPTGWTQDVTLNDRALRVVSTAAGGTGGSWTVSGLTVATSTTVTPSGTVTVDDHVLTIAEMPSHTHGYDHLVSSGTIQATSSAQLSQVAGTTDATGGGLGHSHTGSLSLSATATATSTPTFDGNWRPLYVDVLRATKD